MGIYVNRFGLHLHVYKPLAKVPSVGIEVFTGDCHGKHLIVEMSWNMRHRVPLCVRVFTSPEQVWGHNEL